MEQDLLNEKKMETIKRKGLIKQLRTKMQAACKNTKTLPRELWDKFKVADDDGSGRLEVPAPALDLMLILRLSLSNIAEHVSFVTPRS